MINFVRRTGVKIVITTYKANRITLINAKRAAYKRRRPTVPISGPSIMPTMLTEISRTNRPLRAFLDPTYYEHDNSSSHLSNRPQLHRTTATSRYVDIQHHRRANSRCSVAQHHLLQHYHNPRADGDNNHHHNLTMDWNSSR
nr:unnamed protein product [Spirometra erinaceieuropaei]